MGAGRAGAEMGAALALSRATSEVAGTGDGVDAVADTVTVDDGGEGTSDATGSGSGGFLRRRLCLRSVVPVRGPAIAGDSAGGSGDGGGGGCCSSSSSITITA